MWSDLRVVRGDRVIARNGLNITLEWLMTY